jgi:hypothetical protein
MWLTKLTRIKIDNINVTNKNITMNTTGKLDKLIESKVDQKIREFSTKITSQIKDFLVENGDYNGDSLYQANGFDQEYRPIDYKSMKMYTMNSNLRGGLELTIKQKMIDRATKELLEKVELLS